MTEPQIDPSVFKLSEAVSGVELYPDSGNARARITLPAGRLLRRVEADRTNVWEYSADGDRWHPARLFYNLEPVPEAPGALRIVLEIDRPITARRDALPSQLRDEVLAAEGQTHSEAPLRLAELAAAAILDRATLLEGVRSAVPASEHPESGAASDWLWQLRNLGANHEAQARKVKTLEGDIWEAREEVKETREAFAQITATLIRAGWSKATSADEIAPLVGSLADSHENATDRTVTAEGRACRAERLLAEERDTTERKDNVIRALRANEVARDADATASAERRLAAEQHGEALAWQKVTDENAILSTEIAHLEDELAKAQTDVSALEHANAGPSPRLLLASVEACRTFGNVEIPNAPEGGQKAHADLLGALIELGVPASDLDKKAGGQ